MSEHNNIGLFFGSFNPIHNGHIGLAKYFVENNIVDEVWLVVSPQSPFKQQLTQADAIDRIAMAKLATAKYPNIKVCDIELFLPTPSYTINTLLALKEKYPEKAFSIVLGSDQAKKFSGWKDWDKIIDNFKIYFYPRSKKTGEKYKETVSHTDSNGITRSSVMVNAPLFNISSTEVRKLIADSQSVEDKIPDEVNHYIKILKLYAKPLFIALLFILIPFFSFSQFYNGSQIDFGKKKIQYGNFMWNHYTYDNYDIYFYQNGQNLAIEANRIVKDNLRLIEEKFNIRISNKLRLIIYNTLADLNQSNLGTLANTFYNTGGISYIIENKIFIYFNGDMANFDQQIVAGLYKIVMQEAMKNSRFAEILNNSETVNDWFTDGLAAYFSKTWDSKTDNEFRNILEGTKLKNIKDIDGKYAAIAGQSLWKYIADNYGKNIPLEIFTVAVRSKNYYDSFKSVIGLEFNDLNKAWLNYYSSLYESYPKDKSEKETILAGNKRKSPNISNIRISPNGRYVAYTTNESGLKKLFIKDLQNGNKKRVYKTGYRSYNKTDETFPVVAWHPKSNILAVATEEAGGTKLFYYDVNKGNIFFPVNIPLSSLSFQKITDIAFSPDAKYLVLSAVKNGQSDIYIWNTISGVSRPITNDIYNDFNPRFINNHGDIVFSSNRYCDDKNIKSDNDLYKVNINNPENILKLTESELVDEIDVRRCGNDNIAYLSDENGIYNLYIAKFDSAISFIDTTTHYNYHIKSNSVTNNGTSIIDYDIAGDKLVTITADKNIYYITRQTIPALSGNKALTNYEPLQKTYIKQLAIAQDSVAKSGMDSESKKKTLKFFDVEEPDYSEGLPTRRYILGIEADSSVLISSSESYKYDNNTVDRDKWKYYKPEFFINSLITQIDFTSMSNSYQQYTGGTFPIYLYKGFNLLTGVGITDLMEDYHITGAFSLSSDLINNEYALMFSNLKKRMDKEFVFHKYTDINYHDSYGYVTEKQQTHELIYKLTWPFTEFLYVSGSAIGRHTKITTTSLLDVTKIGEASPIHNWVGLRGELVFDNSINVCQNILSGTRFKIFGEYNQLITKDNRNLVVLGFDFRNYQRIYKEVIFAWRLAGSTSFGTDKLIYYMGGVDNWILPVFDTDNQVSPDINYAFQTLATNLRGFPQNARNGPNFVVLNTELRFPFVRVFANKPLRSKFLNSLQLIGFCDAGTAWNGLTPYSEENALYRRRYIVPPMYIIVNEHREPFLVGFGTGIRASVLGYFIRVDYGWGLEDGVINDGYWNVSLSLDF